MTPLTTDDALRRLLDDGRARAAATDPGHARLWEALTAATEGGKRFRPALVTAAHDALGGRRPDAAATVGAAVGAAPHRLRHPRRRDRRGRPATRPAQRERHLPRPGPGRRGRRRTTPTPSAGRPASWPATSRWPRRSAPWPPAAAPREVVQPAAGPLRRRPAHDRGRGARRRAALAGRRDRVAPREPGDGRAEDRRLLLRPARCRPARCSPTPTRARCAGSARPGGCWGPAFQLLDDLLGVFGDPARTGKSATSDLRARKQTPLLAHASTTPEWDRIRSYVGRDLTDAELAEVRRLLTVSGSRRFVEELAAGAPRLGPRRSSSSWASPPGCSPPSPRRPRSSRCSPSVDEVAA